MKTKKDTHNRTEGALYAYDDLIASERDPEWGKLDRALKDERITNIAISAPYDTGKSSFLLSYFLARRNIFKKRRRKDFRFISIPNFFQEKEENKNLEIELEKDIIDQLILPSQPKKFPDSNIKRIKKIPTKSTYIVYILSLILFGILTNFSITLNKNIFLNFFAWVIMILFGWKIFCLIMRIYNKSLFTLSAKWNITDSATLQAGLVPTNAEDKGDKFVEYNDELRYFFDKTKVRYVIFEDLDRYNSPLIFQRLRALNKRLNASRRKSIVFIYTLRDSIFTNSDNNQTNESKESNENFAAEQRAKFFDYVISLFPLHSFENSIDEFKKEAKTFGLDDNINEDYFYELGKLIHDKREIINIMNDMDTYAKKLNLENLVKKGNSYDKLFGLMIYKNIYPEDFDKLIDGNSFLARLLNEKDEIISKFDKKATKKDKYNWGKIIKEIKEVGIDEFPFSASIKNDLRTLFQKKIMYFLISNNLLDSDFYNYLSPTYFEIENQEDREFINRVLTHDKRSNDTIPLTQLDKIIKYLIQIDADFSYAANVDLLNSLIEANNFLEYEDQIKVILTKIKENLDYSFITYWINLYKKDEYFKKKVEALLNYWPNFFDNILDSKFKNMRDWVLELLVYNIDETDRIAKFLISSKFFEDKEVQHRLEIKLNNNTNYRSKFIKIIKSCDKLYKFRDMTSFIDKENLLINIIKYGWYTNSIDNFKIVVENVIPAYDEQYLYNDLNLNIKWLGENIRKYKEKILIYEEENKYFKVTNHIYLTIDILNKLINFSKYLSNYHSKLLYLTELKNIIVKFKLKNQIDKKLWKNLNIEINKIRQLSFYNWLKSFQSENTFLGDLAQIASKDKNFPKEISNWSTLNNYLKMTKANKEVGLMLKKAWKTYSNDHFNLENQIDS